MGRIAKMALVLVLCGLCLSTFVFGQGHGKNGKMLIGYTGFAPTLIFYIKQELSLIPLNTPQTEAKQ